jgi:glyoxylase-like metal-dependent hydrolase (beta-lactamase superfamily II)
MSGSFVRVISIRSGVPEQIGLCIVAACCSGRPSTTTSAARPIWSATTGHRVAAVVEPRFEIGVYLDLARYMGVRIEHILETHDHADHAALRT